MEYKLHGKIIVIKVGANSLVDGKPISHYLNRIYNLDELEGDYKKFVGKFSNVNIKNLTSMALDFAFNVVFKNDPHLPKEFLPENWIGYEAKNLYDRLIRRSTY